jgi:hypothetical protein
MPQWLDYRTFHWDPENQVLSEDASSLTTQINLTDLIRFQHHLDIIGARQTRRYQLDREVRETATNEVGDILSWEFRCVDAFGRFIPGPKLIIFND